MNVSEHTAQVGALLARQPIMDNSQKVVAYELLCRSADRNLSNEQATADVLVNAFSETSLQKLSDGKLCYINFTFNLLDIVLPFEGGQVVVEVLEHCKVDEKLLESLKALKARGFQIALDDYVLTNESVRLLPYADIIKLDVLAMDRELIAKYVEKLRPLKNTLLLAEKVEDQDMYHFCKDLGFDLYQGYFFAKPEIIEGQRIKEGKQSLLRLMGLLNDEEADVDVIEQTIASDPVLTFKLVSMVNSAGMGVSQKVDSLRHCIAILGLEKLRSWTMLLSLANLSDKPSVLNVQALELAKLSELLGEKLLGEGKRCFSLGLFSVLDVYLDTQLKDILPNMSLSLDLEDALLERGGEMGAVLTTVENYICGEWASLDLDDLAARGVSADALCEMYLQSQTWAAETMASMEKI